MKEKFLIAVIILLNVFSLNSVAQNNDLKFNLVEGNNGEPLGAINGITQDKQGFMWFSGAGKQCLYRFDGTRMIAYRHDPLNTNSLGHGDMETVYADPNGKIWIGFLGGGLDQYEPETGKFNHFNNNPSDSGTLSAGLVSVILRDHRGNLWVGTHSGLNLLDEKTGKFTHYRHDRENTSSLSSDTVRAIYEDHKGVLWIGTGYEFYNYYNGDGGLNRMEPNGTFTRFLHDPHNPNSLINNKVKAIFEDSRGIFWIGTCGDGLHTMDREKGVFERHPYNPAHPEQLSRPPLKDSGKYDPISFIVEDSIGSIWIGTYLSGINRYDTGAKKISRYESNKGYPDKGCWRAFTSRDGILWLASMEDNPFLYRADPSIKTVNNILIGAMANCIHQDDQGLIWVGVSGKGLLQYDQMKNLVHTFKNEVSDSINLLQMGLNSFFQNQPDSLWIGTSNGIILFNKRTSHFSWLRYKDKQGGLPKKFEVGNVSQIIQDKNGLKWIGSWGDSAGLFQYNPENQIIKHYLPDEMDTGTINSMHVPGVLEDPSGDIWAGAYTEQAGINRLNIQTGRFRHYLNGVNILHFYRDSKGIIWVATGIGLYRFDKEADNFTPFFDSLSDFGKTIVNSIIEDDLKNLWIVTESVIIKLYPDRIRYFIYGRKYGIKPGSLAYGGIGKTSNGEILVGNPNGFYSFSPVEKDFENKPPQIIISDFFINNTQITSGKGSLLENPIGETSEISLHFNQNIFSFYCSVIDYHAPEANKCYTMLENFDNVWREVIGDKSVIFINVPPGKYVFRVKAYNIEGKKAEKAIQIIINPPWWKTWWAYSIYGLILLTVAFFMDRLQKQRTIIKERQKAQVKELAQAKEIEKAYTELKSMQAQLIQSEKMASLGELTAGIAHEIQNPLNFVNNFSEVNKELIEELKAEAAAGNNVGVVTIANDISENEEKISHHGKRADAIVKGMLQHSRTSAGQKEPTDINALADEYLRLAYHGLRAKDKEFNAGLKTHFENMIGNINIIPQDIGRVLINLYNNAFYSVSEKKRQQPEGYEPEVTVSTKKTVNKVEISVKDNGLGIPHKVLDKIFQPFFTTKPTGQGTGLGLSLSYDIIKSHGGEIKVESKEGEYSEFIILLPV